jgi:hypothetical protein
VSSAQVKEAVKVVASAVSVKRSLAVQVSEDGFVSGVRLLSAVVRRWDTWDFGERTVAVAAVAHDRYLSNLPNREGRFPSRDEVAAAERRLNF